MDQKAGKIGDFTLLHNSRTQNVDVFSHFVATFVVFGKIYMWAEIVRYTLACIFIQALMEFPGDVIVIVAIPNGFLFISSFLLCVSNAFPKH